jgi:uncharacterized protein YbjT (DUF2867 family)
MIVVAGGTGTLGTRLVPGLAERGLAVRVLTRDPARAQHLAGHCVEVVHGDVRDPGSVARALHGAGMVISAVHGFAGPGGVSPASVDRAGNARLIHAAARTGAAFVLVSVVGASPSHPIGLFRAKHAAEQALRASGLPWTIVRATAFMETWGQIMGRPLQTSGIPRPALRVMAGLTAAVKPALARQARAALAMDTIDMRFDPAATRRAFPNLPNTSIHSALKSLLA